MAMSDRWVAGVGLGYGHDRTKVGDNGTLSEADSYVGALYGSWRATDDLIVDGVLGYGSLAFDSRRWSADAGEFAFGERSGSVLFGSASVALERSAAGLAWAPYARVQFGKVDLDGFTENGAGVFALKYDAMTVDTLATALGASFDWTLQRRSGLLTPSLRVEWRHEFEGADDQTVSYADWLASPDYMVGLEHWARDSLSLSLGVEWQAVSGWSYGADYNGQAGSDLISHGLKLRLSKAF
jgi:outer membrane autotransporter protein